ncbi:MAG TPA: 30S ribosomal protein S20 [Bacilli bacterium]|nr:30S ribosomal protein S20 [Bacilli bacterium]
MANIKSSKKAIKVIKKKTDANHEYKARVKNSIKATEKAILAADKKLATELYKTLQKDIDKALQKGLIKENTANRAKSRLNKKIKEMK